MGMALMGIATIGSIVCWVMVLIKMFTNKEKGGVVQGVIGILCGLWAFIWGWMNSGIVGKNVMLAWTACFVLNIVAQVLFGASMAQ